MGDSGLPRRVGLRRGVGGRQNDGCAALVYISMDACHSRFPALAQTERNDFLGKWGKVDVRKEKISSR